MPKLFTISWNFIFAKATIFIIIIVYVLYLFVYFPKSVPAIKGLIKYKITPTNNSPHVIML